MKRKAAKSVICKFTLAYIASRVQGVGYKYWYSCLNKILQMVSEQFCMCEGLKFVSWKEIIFNLTEKS